MLSNYSYTGFGLNILSEIHFPEFLPVSCQYTDVYIKLVNREASYEDNKQEWEKSFTTETDEGAIFQVAKVARYTIKKGSEIEVNPYPGGDQGAVRLFLLSNAMAILLIQRGQILLHASAIRLDDGLVVFMGNSGAGKSSMLAELLRRGYMPFSDDVLVIEEDPYSGEIIAFPSYPMIKLWKETMEIIGTQTTGEGHRLRQGVDKFGHFFHDRYRTEPMRIKQLVVIEKDPSCISYCAAEPGGLDSFEMISRNIYRRQFIQQDFLRKKHLKLLGKLLSQVKVKIIRRPVTGSSIEKFADFAENQLGLT